MKTILSRCAVWLQLTLLNLSKRFVVISHQGVTTMSRKDQFWEEDEENAQMSEEQAEAILEASQKEESVAESEEYAEVDDEEIALTEEEAEEADQAYDASVMADARLRLEQGRLYEMLLEHSLFKDVDADARAIKNVEREIKAYIRERLEILVGLKVDKAKQVSGNAGQFKKSVFSVL